MLGGQIVTQRIHAGDLGHRRRAERGPGASAADVRSRRASASCGRPRRVGRRLLGRRLLRRRLLGRRPSSPPAPSCAGAFFAGAFLAGPSPSWPAAFLAGAFLARRRLLGRRLLRRRRPSCRARAPSSRPAPSWPGPWPGRRLPGRRLLRRALAGAFFAGAFLVAVGCLLRRGHGHFFRRGLSAVFERGAGREPHRRRCGDLDLLAGLRVAAGARRPLGRAERTEAGPGDLVALLRRLGDVIEERASVRSASTFDTPADFATASISSALVMCPLSIGRHRRRRRLGSRTDPAVHRRRQCDRRRGAAQASRSLQMQLSPDRLPDKAERSCDAQALVTTGAPGPPSRRRTASRVRPLVERLAQRRRDRRRLAGGVLAAGPEEPAQAVALRARHDVHVEVGDALADDVVVGDERSLRPERSGHHRGHALHALEERPDVDELGQRHDVVGRHHEDVAGEQRRAIEEGDGDLVAVHDLGRRRAGDDGAERAVRRPRRPVWPRR